MKVIIIGANGKVGRLIAQKMSASDEFEPTALIRKKEQKAYFDSIGVPVVVESIENSEENIGDAIRGFDAVVFSAGSGGATGADKTIEVDLFGAVKTIEAAKKNSISRFVMISAALSDDPSSWTSDGMKPYYIAKHMADKELKRSGLDYTIVRPVMLTDNDDAGKITIQSETHQLNKEIPRAAVAETVLKVLPNSGTHSKILEMSEGSSEIGKAIAEFVA